MLTCQHLTKSYRGFPALRDLNLEIPSGRIVGLLGPNGSGKTTLIKLIAGLAHPTSGQVLINGMPPGPQTKALVSYLPERPYFARSVRIQDMLDLFSDFYSDFDRALAQEMLMRLNLDSRATIATLSKGSVEKVQLILVMARQAQLYLLDEPIGGVDPAAREYVLETIIKGYRPNSTVIISTHLVSDVEAVLDDFIFLRQGSIVVHAPLAYATETRGMSLDTYFREEFRC